MKLSIISALLLSLTLMSCKKDYVCECTATFSDTGTQIDAGTYTFFTTEKKAIEECNNKGGKTPNYGIIMPPSTLQPSICEITNK